MSRLLRQSCHVMSGKNQATACQVTCDTSTFKIMKLHLNFITCATFPQAGRQYHIQDSSPQPVSPITCCHLDTSLVSCPHRFIDCISILKQQTFDHEAFLLTSPPISFVPFRRSRSVFTPVLILSFSNSSSQFTSSTHGQLYLGVP